MRKKMNIDEKRSEMIGVKVQPELKEKLAYIARRDVKPLSTYIYEILEKEVNDFFKHTKIPWDDLTEEEKKGIMK